MSATEQLQTRLGQQGLSGAYFVRRFWVQHTQGADPLADSQLPPLYDPYPHNQALLALDHRLESRFTQTSCIVEVIYGDPLIVPPITAGPWSISVNTSIGSEQIYVTPILTTRTNPPQPSTVIGPHVYTPGSGFTSTSNSNGTVTSINLTQLQGRKRRGIERRVPVGALVAFARFFSVSMNSLASAQNYVTYVNELDWYGYSAETLMFSGLAIDYVPDPAGITPRGYATDVRLIFECNRNGWAHNETDTYQSDEGYEDTVRDSTGNAVSTNFHLYERINFDVILGLIG